MPSHNKQAFEVDHVYDQGEPNTTTRSTNVPSNNKQAFGVDHAYDRGVPITTTSQQKCLPTTNKLLESIMLMIKEYLILAPTQQTSLLTTKQAFGVDHACDREVPNPPPQQTCLPTTKYAFGVDHACDRGVPNTTTNSENMPTYD
ncbi:hypothetical protein TIFTF001_007086 [Ficus carica]|uniref:Uncharacterized protein n=1 Tax=Ficus carica TaxID=3494 RepID=A0AA88D0H9_FICCA|nr:hypothetical protein TIFTF001_007086 [Ficus carica]